MYSVLNREGRYGEIVHYLADSDDDLELIVDNCAPGSTIEVLKDSSETEDVNVHTYIKSPNGEWTLYEGTVG